MPKTFATGLNDLSMPNFDGGKFVVPECSREQEAEFQSAPTPIEMKFRTGKPGSIV